MDDVKFQTAVQLARMYGVAETLHPVKCLGESAFIALITELTDAYLLSDENDVVTYFSKIFEDYKTKNQEIELV